MYCELIWPVEIHNFYRSPAQRYTQANCLSFALFKETVNTDHLQDRSHAMLCFFYWNWVLMIGVSIMKN